MHDHVISIMHLFDSYYIAYQWQMLIETSDHAEMKLHNMAIKYLFSLLHADAFPKEQLLPTGEL